MSVRDLIILGCSSQQPTRRRNHSGYLFRWNEEGLLFDPGEGTQRQFIFADIAPTVVTRIFVSHFHGDHCLGLGSLLMRLNLDKVTHPIHCYYPASGKKYFDRLRYGTIYHETITVVEHPVSEAGLVHDDGRFRIEAVYLDHGIETLGWRVTEPSTRKFDPQKLQSAGVRGPMVRKLQEKGELWVSNRCVRLDDVSEMREGEAIAVVLDTRYCQNAVNIARNSRLLLCESTFLNAESILAEKYAHLTARQAAAIAKEADAKQLILTHFSARYPDAKDFLLEAKEVFPNTDVSEDLKRFPFPKNR